MNMLEKSLRQAPALKASNLATSFPAKDISPAENAETAWKDIRKTARMQKALA